MAYASAYEDAADQTRRQKAAPQFSPHHHRGHALRGGPCDGRHGMVDAAPPAKRHARTSRAATVLLFDAEPRQGPHTETAEISGAAEGSR
jgi:hypothetical protein